MYSMKNFIKNSWLSISTVVLNVSIICKGSRRCINLKLFLVIGRVGLRQASDRWSISVVFQVAPLYVMVNGHLMADRDVSVIVGHCSSDSHHLNIFILAMPLQEGGIAAPILPIRTYLWHALNKGHIADSSLWYALLEVIFAVVATLNLLCVVHATMELTHSWGQLLHKLIHCNLILILLRYLIRIFIFMNSLPCHLGDDVLALSYALMDLLTEILAAEWALGLDIKPVLAAFRMEVMLWVTGKNDQIVFCHERDQADGAIRHFEVFLFIVLQTGWL